MALPQGLGLSGLPGAANTVPYVLACIKAMRDSQSSEERTALGTHLGAQHSRHWEGQ